MLRIRVDGEKSEVGSESGKREEIKRQKGKRKQEKSYKKRQELRTERVNGKSKRIV